MEQNSSRDYLCNQKALPSPLRKPVRYAPLHKEWLLKKCLLWAEAGAGALGCHCCCVMSRMVGGWGLLWYGKFHPDQGLCFANLQTRVGTCGNFAWKTLWCRWGLRRWGSGSKATSHTGRAKCFQPFPHPWSLPRLCPRPVCSTAIVCGAE